MKWLFNKCGRHEASLSLLAVDGLPDSERAKLEAHVANCAACRAKLSELQILARGLSRVGQRLPEVEAPTSLRWRWMTAVRQSAHAEVGRGVLTAPDVEGAESGAPRAARPAESHVLGWLSGRRLAWGSLTAMWAMVLFFRFSAPDGPKPASVASAPPVSLREVLLALKVDSSPSLLRADASKASHRKPTAPDALPPRSQRSPVFTRDWEVA